MTTTLTREDRMAHSDPAGRSAEMAAKRELRFQKRRAAIDADKLMDPRLRELLLDREIWNTRRAAEELAVRPNHVSVMRSRRLELTHPHPHPSVFLTDPDTIENVTAGQEDPGIEAGRIREWALEVGRMVWDAVEGKLIPSIPRHGRVPATTERRPRRRPTTTAGTPVPAEQLARMAAEREQRFLVRKAFHEADAALDDELRKLLLDRKIWNTRRIADELDMGPGRVSSMRTKRTKPTRPPTHPSVLPAEPDTIERVIADKQDPGYEAGRIREWALEVGRMVWDAERRQLYPSIPHQGRPVTNIDRTPRRTARHVQK